MKLCRILIVVLLLAAPVFASEDGEVYDESVNLEASDWDTSSSSATDLTVSSDDSNAIKDEVVLSDNEKSQNDNNEMFIPKRPTIQTTVADKPQKPSMTPPGDSLTERLQKDPQNKNDNLIEGTWIEKLGELSPSKLLNIEDEDKNTTTKKESEVDDEKNATTEEDADIDDMMKVSRQNAKNTRSNAAVFDIAGVMLRMNVQQTEEVLSNRGFKKINARYQVPNFIKWRNEEICRNSGVVGYERLQACMLKKAKKDGFEYIEYLKFAKFETKEEIEVYFSSNFTDNKVYKIYYTSNIVSINGNSPKAVYLRNLKIYDFWRKISRKYGNPDDKNRVVWGLGGNKPYLKAKTGKLKLEDPMFIETDYDKMAQADQRFISSDFYNF